MSTATRIAALSLTAAAALALTACGGTDSEPTSAVPTLTQTTTSTATTAPTTESETSPETTLSDQAALTEVDAERFRNPDTYGYMVTFAEDTTCTVWESDSGGNPTVDCDFPFPDNVLVEAEIPPMATPPEQHGRGQHDPLPAEHRFRAPRPVSGKHAGSVDHGGRAESG